MFCVNNKEYTVETYRGSKIYTINDFYKYPDKIVDFISGNEPHYHKSNIKPSFNGVAFHDMRHDIQVEGLEDSVDILKPLCNQENKFGGRLLTNHFKLVDKRFNNYKDNYWWPHEDSGYTAIIYLNQFSYPGTNLYTPIEPPNYNQIEHFVPWQSKKKWNLGKNLKAEYNKLVFFNSSYNPHGMDISSDLFYNEIRLNQVLFFAP